MNQSVVDDPHYSIRSAGCSFAGTRHRRRNLPPEDALRMTRDPDFCFFGIADGQSGKPGGKLGGERSLQALESCLREMGVAGITDYPFPDELPCILMQRVRKALSGLVQERGGSFSDYASTLLAVAIEPATLRYVLLHLGDGCALEVQEGQEPRLISQPQNGFTGCETWLTTSENAVPHFRVSFGRLVPGSRILLMSDGARGLCRGKNIPRQARPLLRGGSPEEIADYLKQTEPEDDSSCIILDIPA